MSEEKSRKPNLTQVMQSQKLVSEITTLVGVINLLHNRICAANFIHTGQIPTGPIPRRPSQPRQPDMGLEYQPFFSQPFSGEGDPFNRVPSWLPNFGWSGPNSPNMFGAPQSNPMFDIFAQLFSIDPAKITPEQLSGLMTDVINLQTKIMDMVSSAVAVPE